ncbi:MAG: hypothetical protein AAF958_18370 [Planctomycetota bacterium]
MNEFLHEPLDGQTGAEPTALAAFLEMEPDAERGLRKTLTVILRASRCPIACAMCDLHHAAYAGPTPPGSIPAQVQAAVSQWGSADRIKLYNGGNFFDPRSIPVKDYPAILDAIDDFDELVVENHPSVGIRRTLPWARRWGKSLEIAVGLESVRPGMLAMLQKRTSRDGIDGYLKWLEAGGIRTRVFLLLGGPGHPADEALRWAELSVRHAALLDAAMISLIPARGGESWSDGKPPVTDWSKTDLVAWQSEVIARLRQRGRRSAVTIDAWDFPPHDRQRIQAANLDQQW